VTEPGRAHGGALLAALLAEHGVRHVFGVPGGQTLALYDGIADVDGLAHVQVRDERSAAYAADAYARVTGRAGVCDATVGPGAAKLPSGLAEALGASVPVLALVSDLPARLAPHRYRGAASQALDQAALLAPVTKWQAAVPDVGTLPALVRQAFREATTGRPGPVALFLPQDVLDGPAPAGTDAGGGAAGGSGGSPPRVGSFFSHKFLLASLQPVEVGLQVQDGALDQEPRRGVSRIGFGLQLGQVTHYAEIMPALGVHQLHPVGESRHRGQDELDEELVADARSVARLADPGAQRLPAGRGELVDPLVRPGGLLDVLAADQTVLLEALQRDVDLPDVRRWIRLAEGLFKREFQLVAVSRLLSEQGQQGLPHDPVTSLSPEGPALRLTPRITRK